MTVNHSRNEALLIQQIAQRDENALSILYDCYAPILYGLAFRILGSKEEAEEAIVDVFVQVWQNPQKYQAERGSVDAWLFLLTRSRSLDRLRAVQRQTKAVEASTNKLHSDPISAYLTPEESLLIAERRDRVGYALEQIPCEQRQALELAYFQGLTYSEIGAATGKTLGTVKTRLRLGLSKLRSLLQFSHLG